MKLLGVPNPTAPRAATLRSAMEHTTAASVLESFDVVVKAKDAESRGAYAEARELYEQAVERLLSTLPSLGGAALS